MSQGQYTWIGPAREGEIDPVELRRFTAKLAILHLITMNKITGEEYSRMYNMIESPDTENLIVTEELIKQLCK